AFSLSLSISFSASPRKQIRGPGLAYGYGIRLTIEEGFVRLSPCTPLLRSPLTFLAAQLAFNLTKSVNLPRAYQAAKQVVQDFVSGKVQFLRRFRSFYPVHRSP